MIDPPKKRLPPRASVRRLAEAQAMRDWANGSDSLYAQGMDSVAPPSSTAVDLSVFPKEKKEPSNWLPRLGDAIVEGVRDQLEAPAKVARDIARGASSAIGRGEQVPREATGGDLLGAALLGPDVSDLVRVASGGLFMSRLTGESLRNTLWGGGSKRLRKTYFQEPDALVAYLRNEDRLKPFLRGIDDVPDAMRRNKEAFIRRLDEMGVRNAEDHFDELMRRNAEQEVYVVPSPPGAEQSLGAYSPSTNNYSAFPDSPAFERIPANKLYGVMRSTGIHEGSHAISTQGEIQYRVKEALKPHMVPNAARNIDTNPSLRPPPGTPEFRGLDGMTLGDYLTDPREVQARLGQVRFDLDADRPWRRFTEDDIRRYRGGTDNAFAELRYPVFDEFNGHMMREPRGNWAKRLAGALNATIAGGGVATTALLGQRQQEQR